MIISVSEDKTYNFEPKEINNLKDLSELVTRSNWSCSVYKNGHRNLSNFEYADFIALDIDGGMTLDEAQSNFEGYQHVICTTRNHRKLKNGLLADRFRVILKLSKRITDLDEYYGAWADLKSRFPQIDPQCPDPSRLWFRSPKVVKVKEQGTTVDPIKIERNTTPVDVKIGMKGNLARKTLDFIVNGAEPGTWNHTIYEAALDLRSQGYTHDEALTMLGIATRNFSGELDGSDLASITSAYSGDTYHEKRGVEDCFNFERVGDIIKTKIRVKWLVDGLLTEGGISVTAGPPKSGKSTITRQMCKAIAQGEGFLGRKTKKGKVLYLALEEQREMLAEQLRQQGVTNEDELFIHVGPVIAENKYEMLERIIHDLKPSLVVVDTMVLFAGITDVNNYNESYKAISKFRVIARNTGSHINFIHHQNKGDNRGANSIMGSVAIHGSVDNAIIFNKIKTKRYISTSQRGGRGFEMQYLEFDAEKQMYELGVEEF